MYVPYIHECFLCKTHSNLLKFFELYPHEYLGDIDEDSVRITAGKFLSQEEWQDHCDRRVAVLKEWLEVQRGKQKAEVTDKKHENDGNGNEVIEDNNVQVPE